MDHEEKIASLSVSEALIRQAAVGDVDEPAFVETLRQFLLYAWGIVKKLLPSPRQEEQEWANRATASPASPSAIAPQGGWRGGAIRNQILSPTPELQNC